MQILGLTDDVLGIILALVTSLLWNIAPIIQKEALEEIEEIDAKNPLKQTRKLFSKPRWVMGFTMALIGGLTYMLATNLAGIVVIQPLMNVGLIALVFFSSRRLGETIDIPAAVGIILMILTPVFIGLGGVTEPVMFTEYSGILLFSATMLIGIGAMAGGTKKIAILWAPITSLFQALASQFTQWFTLALFGNPDFIQGFINAFIPLILTGVFTAIAAVYTVSIGLQRNPASRFNAITGTISMFAVILGGIMIFGQVITNIPFYSIGLIFGMIGVILLSKYQDDQLEEEMAEDDEVIQ
ncbi:MAG: DMT family transporter [Candidatus Thorarchaeota archaeon]